MNYLLNLQEAGGHQLLKCWAEPLLWAENRGSKAPTGVELVWATYRSGYRISTIVDLEDCKLRKPPAGTESDDLPESAIKSIEKLHSQFKKALEADIIPERMANIISIKREFANSEPTAVAAELGMVKAKPHPKQNMIIVIWASGYGWSKRTRIMTETPAKTYIYSVGKPTNNDEHIIAKRKHELLTKNIT